MRDILSRREFLAYSSALAAGITLGELGRRQLARADDRATRWRDRGVETWTTSVCRECPASCGLQVRLIDGVPVKLEGNPLCPIGRGRLCARGQAAIESYFDPDRLLGPAERVGPRSASQWRRITWEAGIDQLTGRLQAAQSEPGAILALAAEEEGPLAQAWARFWRAAGARVAWTAGATSARLRPPLATLTGASGDPIFDLERATHVLSFGAPIVEDWLSCVWAQRAYGYFRRGVGRSRGRLVQIEERHSLTARKADQWLAVPEEQQTALAYGIASVLLRENRVNRTFLDEFRGNLAAFERQVVDRFTPDRVAELTGVPVVTILRVARDLTVTPQPLIVVSAEAPPDLIDAVLALNALVGALDRPGGIFARNRPPGAMTDLDDATSALRELETAARRPRIVVLRDASALRARTTPLHVTELLENCDLVVSFSPYLDEAAAGASLLLPSHTSLESWQALRPSVAAASEALACARAAAPVRLDTRDTFAVLGAVAGRIGGKLAAAYPWKTAEAIVAEELDRLWNQRRGAPYSNTFETEWVRQLETGGWWVPPAPTPEQFAETVLHAGGWVDPFFAPGQIRQALAVRGGLAFAPPAVPEAETHVRTGAAGSGDRETGVEEVTATGDTDFPLRLVSFTPGLVNLVGGPNQPILFELLGQPESAPWRIWAEIHPETAAAHGIGHGSVVRIESVSGSVEAVAIHAEGMTADMVALAFVPAVRDGGRWARLHQADARRLWGRGPVTRTCAVRVRQV